MSIEINEEVAVVIDAVLKALDIPYPKTVADERAWMQG